MLDPKNIHPLSDFQRNTKEHLRRLRETGNPEIVTVNGRPEVVVQSAAAYQKLLDAAERARTIPSLPNSLVEADRGLGIPAKQVLAELHQKLGINGRR